MSQKIIPEGCHKSRKIIMRIAILKILRTLVLETYILILSWIIESDISGPIVDKQYTKTAGSCYYHSIIGIVF